MHSAVVFEGPRPTPQQLNFAFPLFPHSLSLKGVPPSLALYGAVFAEQQLASQHKSIAKIILVFQGQKLFRFEARI